MFSNKICMKWVLNRPKPKPKREGFHIEDFALPAFHQEQAGLIHHAELRRTVCERFINLCWAMTAELEAELAEMSYAEFLDTDYWDYLRNYVVLIRGGCCEACDLRVSLEVHHITYAHRGSEWRHLEDLQVLCRGCHAQERKR